LGEHHNKDWQILSRQSTNTLKRVGWHVVAKLVNRIGQQQKHKSQEHARKSKTANPNAQNN